MYDIDEPLKYSISSDKISISPIFYYVGHIPCDPIELDGMESSVIFLHTCHIAWRSIKISDEKCNATFNSGKYW